MKLVTNYVTRKQLASSRTEQTVDNDLQMILLKLSLLSYVFFGTRVQYVVGAGESIGSSPVWMAPGNRLSERFVRTVRGSSGKGGGNKFEDANGAALLDFLREEGGGITRIESMQVKELKVLQAKIFASGNSK